MTKCSHRSPWRSQRWSLRLLLAGLLTAVAVISGVGSTAAFAAPVSQINISRTSASPQASGNTFTYQIAYQCSDVDGETCDDGVITIPLGDAASFGIDVTSAAGLADSWQVVGNDLIIQLPDAVDAGTSGSISVRVVPPNHTTADGTSWELQPTVTGSNFATVSAPQAADGTATADIRPTITKKRDKAFKEPGDEVTWTIRVACQQPGAGNLLVGSMTVVDTLDDDFEYTGSSGGGVYDGAASPRTVTWTYSGADVPTSCSTPGQSGFIEQTVTGNVAGDHTLGQQLPNHADVTATSFDDAKTKTVGADAAVTIVTEGSPPGPGSVQKHGYGQLAGPGAATVSPGAYGDFQSTYPGHWQGLPASTNLSNGSSSVNSSLTSAYYTVIDDSDGKSNQVRDAMPCLDHQLPATTTYQSQLGSVCANPAFHPTAVQVQSYGTEGTVIPPASFQPTAILTNGSSVDLVQGAGTNLWTVPATHVGDVAEIILPGYEVPRRYQLIWIAGYADASLVDGDIVQNVVDVDQYYKGTKIGDLGDSGEIYVVDKPQIGVSKSFGTPGASTGGSTRVTFGNALLTFGVPTEDFVVADLLPAGMTWVGATNPSFGVRKSNVSGTETISMPVGLDLIDNYQGTGRQLVRFTVTAAQLNSFSSAVPGGGEFSVQNLGFDVTTPTDPGIYTNIVAGYYDSASLDVVCRQQSGTQIADDPYDQNGDGSTADRHCEAPATVTIAAANIGPDFKVSKTVQGDSDSAPRAWPAYGTVDEAGGTVEFGLDFKNVAGTPLNTAVMYDLLPRSGDTAVSGSLAGQPRGSAFTPLLTGVDALPAGVTVEYSTEANPCRDEVYADSVNTTCVDDWAATAPADLSDVTGLRFASSATFQAGQGFRVTYDMTTPSIDAGEFAWNSVAARASNANTGSPMLASEPPKVGLTADSTVPPPVIGKTVDKATAVPGDVLTYQVTLSNSGLTTMADVDLVDTLPAGVAFLSATGGGVHSSGVIQWDDLSISSGQTLTFTVTATVQPGAAGALRNIASLPDWATTVQSNNPCTDDPEAACAETEVPSQELTVEKIVDGAAAAHAVGPYTVAVDCQVDEVSMSGFPQDVELEGGETSDPIDVPIGATCTGIESGDGGATSTAISPSDGVEITSSTTAEFELTVTNTFDAGSLVVNKDIAGIGAEKFGEGPFGFDIVCSFQGHEVGRRSIELARSSDDQTAIASEPIGGLPIGASCTVTETDKGGADDLPAAVTVTIAKDSESTPVDTVFAHLTNDFSAGTLEVEKKLTGAAKDADIVQEQVFTVAVTCQVEALDQSGDLVRGTVFSGDVQITGGQIVQVQDSDGELVTLPAGARCFAEETVDRGADEVTVDHATFEGGALITTGAPDDLQTVTITVTNQFDADNPLVLSDGFDLLPDTGGARAAWLMAGALLVGTGLIVVQISRRSRMESPPV